MLERAWREGFDVEGGQQLGNRVVGTTKLVGATEAHALLSSLGFRCRVVDFDGGCANGNPGSPGERVVEWLGHYFFDDEDDEDDAFSPPAPLSASPP